MRRFAPLLPACLLFAAAPAIAADAPALTPSRDVDVVYRMTQPGHREVMQQRVRWDVADGLERVDPPTAGLYVIVDLRAHRLTSVRDAEKLSLEMDGVAGPIGPSAAAGGYRHLGSDSVAGLACAIWQQAAGGEAPQLCFTGDGVLLRVAAGGHTLAEAVSVRYGPSEPGVFRVPADYRRITPPAASAARDKPP